MSVPSAALNQVTETHARRAAPLAIVVLVGTVGLAVVLAAAVYPLVSPLADDWDALPAPELLTNALAGLAWLAVLLVAVARQPDGRLWKLILLLTLALRVDALEYVPSSPVWSVARAFDVVGIAVFVHLVVAYPSGHLRSPFDRGVVLFAYALVAAWGVKEILLAGDWWALGCDPTCVRNVFVIWPNAELYDWLRNALAVVASLLLFPLVVVAIWRHWRGSTGAARRALLPLVVAVPTWLALGLVEILSRELDVQPGIRFFDSLPGTVARTAAWLVLPLGILLGIAWTRSGSRRVARLVVQLGRGVPIGGLRDVLARAIGDPTLELAFAAPSGAGFVDAAGRPMELPVGDPNRTVTRLERGDELLGVLVHDPMIDAEDPGLVEAVGNAARLALENERLAAEVRAQLDAVRASRVRIVEAADAERRRVERDLHDGAQQRLVALALRLQVAKESTPGASGLLDEATAELQTAIGEVRQLARGVHPTILTEAGLRAAIEALAERAPLPVTVEMAERRYDPQVEATAYFVVAEALTNVARHAQASGAQVTVIEHDDRLAVTVEDDGRGEADIRAGSGLRGLADRLAAVDGTLTVSSPAAGGTTVRAELPLDRVAGRGQPDEPEAGPTSRAVVRAVPQAPVAPRRLSRLDVSSPTVLIGGVAASIAVLAIVAWVIGMQPRSPEIGRADGFVRPFDYQVPAGSGVALYPMSDDLHVIRTVSHDSGISIWAVSDVLVDHCASDRPAGGGPGTARARQPGVDGLIAYLRSVDHLHVVDAGGVTIDGRPARRLILTVDDRTGCPDNGPLVLWQNTAPVNVQAIAVWTGNRKDVSVLDVDGATIAIEAWTAGDMDAWAPIANGVVASIRFLHAEPAGSSSIPSSP